MHAGGHRFDSGILHNGVKAVHGIFFLPVAARHKFIDILGRSVMVYTIMAKSKKKHEVE